jgi:hypothetical protein
MIGSALPTCVLERLPFDVSIFFSIKRIQAV